MTPEFFNWAPVYCLNPWLYPSLPWLSSPLVPPFLLTIVQFYSSSSFVPDQNCVSETSVCGQPSSVTKVPKPLTKLSSNLTASTSRPSSCFVPRMYLGPMKWCHWGVSSCGTVRVVLTKTSTLDFFSVTHSLFSTWNHRLVVRSEKIHGFKKKTSWEGASTGTAVWAMSTRRCCLTCFIQTVLPTQRGSYVERVKKALRSREVTLPFSF